VSVAAKRAPTATAANKASRLTLRVHLLIRGTAHFARRVAFRFRILQCHGSLALRQIAAAVTVILFAGAGDVNRPHFGLLGASGLRSGSGHLIDRAEDRSDSENKEPQPLPKSGLKRDSITFPPHCGQAQSGRGDERAFSSEPVWAVTRPDAASS
jgi:hypothetical protein